MNVIYDDGIDRIVSDSFEQPLPPLDEGDELVVRRSFYTLGGEQYYPGDRLTVMGRTEDIPHHRRASTGNLRVLGKNGRTTVWACLEMCLSEGTVERVQNG